MECSMLASVTLPITLQSIGSSAFEKCAALTSIVIPAAVKEIDSDAFRECSLLEKVELSVGLKSIDGGAFQKCVSLREVDIKAPLPPKISKSTFKDIVVGACKFYVPRGCKAFYMKDKQWMKIPLMEKL